jgi:hypothetical protein
MGAPLPKHAVMANRLRSRGNAAGGNEARSHAIILDFYRSMY